MLAASPILNESRAASPSAGPVVLVQAKLPNHHFSMDGQRYEFANGMYGKAEAAVEQWQARAKQVEPELERSRARVQALEDKLDESAIHLYVSSPDGLQGAVRVNWNVVPKGLESAMDFDYLPKPVAEKVPEIGWPMPPQ